MGGKYSHAMPPFTGALGDQIRPLLLEARAADRIRARGATRAGVLVPLYVEGDELHAVFTKRREDLRRHPGEISFPGGRQDQGDADLAATALREAHEEIGLSPDSVELLGALQPTSTIATGYAVYPFVGLLEPGQEWTLSAREVAQVLELSLSALRAGYRRQRLVRRGVPIRTDTYVVGEHLIWGATARILADLFDRIGSLI
jgi:8-oxo-dGTP pyrophosphatase MutT (NUDIX family)